MRAHEPATVPADHSLLYERFHSSSATRPCKWSSLAGLSRARIPAWRKSQRPPYALRSLLGRHHGGYATGPAPVICRSVSASRHQPVFVPHTPDPSGQFKATNDILDLRVRRALSSASKVVSVGDRSLPHRPCFRKRHQLALPCLPAAIREGGCGGAVRCAVRRCGAAGAEAHLWPGRSYLTSCRAGSQGQDQLLLV